jgi:DNA-binding SARP family transcriptional activator
MMPSTTAQDRSSDWSVAPVPYQAAIPAGREGWSRSGGVELAIRVLDSYPYGIIVARRDGSVLAHNPAAARLLGALAERLHDPNDRVLCDILDCRAEAAPLDGLSLIHRAVAERRVLPEVRVDLPPGTTAPAAWITVAPLTDSDDLVIAELRPGRAHDRRRRTTPHWTSGPRLNIHALGRTRIESAEGPIGGQWLENRAGQMLKYLIAERHRVVYPDEIVETLWEDARLRSVPGVRYYIHQLRQHLEPDRPGRGQSSFIGRLEGGYILRRERVTVDVDDFERHITTGLAAADAGDDDRARTELDHGLALYGGDFLADEPYAEWAIPERDRLRSVAANALRVLAELRLANNDLTAAANDLERLAELEPYDPEVHRTLITLALRRGRRTDAVRRYNALRRRMIATFGEDLDFTLADIANA